MMKVRAALWRVLRYTSGIRLRDVWRGALLSLPATLVAAGAMAYVFPSRAAAVGVAGAFALSTLGMTFVSRAQALYAQSSLAKAVLLLRYLDTGAAESWEVVESTVRYDIADGRVWRTFVLRNATDRPLVAFPFSVGALGQVPEARFEELHMTGTPPNSSQQINIIQVFPEMEAHQHTVYAVFMPPVPPMSSLEMSVAYRWKGLWDPLFKEGADFGSYGFGHGTRSASLMFTFPPGYHGSISAVGPLRGVISSDRLADGRQLVTWRLWNLGDGETAQYEVHMERDVSEKGRQQSGGT